jgi:hypothetical protein
MITSEDTLTRAVVFFLGYGQRISTGLGAFSRIFSVDSFFSHTD